MVKPNAPLEEIYNKYKDQDGFLYLVYAEENIYGWAKLHMLPLATYLGRIRHIYRW